MIRQKAKKTGRHLKKGFRSKLELLKTYTADTTGFHVHAFSSAASSLSIAAFRWIRATFFLRLALFGLALFFRILVVFLLFEAMFYPPIHY